MIAVFLRRGKAVIKGPFFGEIGKPETTADCRRWSFYTASVLASSNYAPEVRAHHRLKSCGRDSVHSAGNWRAMADAYACRDTVCIDVRSVG